MQPQALSRRRRPPELEFLDLQVNGIWHPEHGPIDFSGIELTDLQIDCVVDRWASFGTRVFLPTIVTAPKRVYRSNLPLLGEAVKHRAKDSLAGIHLEGPWISRHNHARGAHPKVHCHRERIEEFCEFDELSQGTIVLITLAPEWPGALKFIEFVTKRGVVVSLGHHLADAGCVREAAAAGASCSTHVGNACPVELHRHDILLWQQILHQSLACCFITDRRHIGDEFARLAIAAKRDIGSHLPIIVSDASPAAKAPPGYYRIFNGREVKVRYDGAVVVPGVRPVKYAGSGSSLMDCMQGALDLGFSGTEVKRMASENAWKLIEGALRTRLCRVPQDYSVPRRRVPKIRLSKGAFTLSGG